MRVSWHERVIFGFQSSSLRICYIFTFPPKMGAVSWGRWRGNGPKTYLLSHNPINNEEALASWWRQLAPAHSAPGWKLFDVERSPLTIFLFYALPLKAERWLFCSRHRVSEHQKCRFWGWKKKRKVWQELTSLIEAISEIPCCSVRAGVVAASARWELEPKWIRAASL